MVVKPKRNELQANSR